MGAQQSSARVKTDVVNKIVTDIIMSSTANCTANTEATQTLSFSNIKTVGCRVDFSNISQEMDVAQDFSCVQENSKDADLQNALKTKLEAAADAATEGQPILSVANSRSVVVSKSIADVVNKVNISSISNCIAKAVAAQLLTIGKIEMDCSGMDDPTLTFNNIKQKLTLAQVANCTQNDEQASAAISKFENDLKGKSTSSVLGITEATSIVASIASCCVLMLLIVAIMYFKDEIAVAATKGKSGGGK
jgi:hypothetical protein